VREVNFLSRLTLEWPDARTQPDVKDIPLIVYICLFNLLFFPVIFLIEGTLIQQKGMDQISSREGSHLEDQKDKSNRRFWKYL
jgi:hypothetical protein